MSKEYNGYEPEKEPLKNTISKKWNDFINYCKNNKKKILIAFGIFFAVAFVAILIDQLTKTFLFEWNEDHNGGKIGKVYYEGTLLGVRSVGHYGVTFIPSAENKRGALIFIQFLSILILLGLLLVPLLSRHLTTIIICAIIWAGDFGNMLDRFMFNMMVKDIFYVPFMEKWTGKVLGTFNFADLCIVLGCISLVLFFVIEMILEKRREAKHQETQEIIDSIQEDNSQNKTVENDPKEEQEDNKKE